MRCLMINELQSKISREDEITVNHTRDYRTHPLTLEECQEIIDERFKRNRGRT